MGMVILCIGIVGVLSGGEGCPYYSSSSQRWVLGLEGLWVCDLDVLATNWLKVLCLAKSLLKTAGLFSKPFCKMLILVPMGTLEDPHHIKITWLTQFLIFPGLSVIALSTFQIGMPLARARSCRSE